MSGASLGRSHDQHVTISEHAAKAQGHGRLWGLLAVPVAVVDRRAQPLHQDVRVIVLL